MFSLIYASLLAYMTKKGGKPSNLGALVFVLIIADLIALNIIF